MNFLLIPGAGGEAWVWSRVESELIARGHAAASIELPADDESCGIKEYAERALSTVEDGTNPLVVGLSLGAFTAASVCLEIETTSLTFVNGMIPLPGETPGEWWEATGQPTAKAANDVRDGRDPEAPFDPLTTFFHDVPAEVAVEAEYHNRMQSSGPFTSSWALPRWPDVPIHVVIGRGGCDHLMRPRRDHQIWPHVALGNGGVHRFVTRGLEPGTHGEEVEGGTVRGDP